MSLNGVSTAEDTEMTDCDGEKVVTMMDVLQEQQDFEDDANAVLGASDDKECTYAKGYIKRQAIYACLTCCGEAKEDPSKRAGVCLACSLNCHENHELVELYTKRNFRCDCGNPKFNSHPCQFTPDKTDMNVENSYNQNFSGLYCTCNRPYPDPESANEDEMIQCIICEDWLHSLHLEAAVPPQDQYSEMICKLCMDKNEFLHDYSEFAVNLVENETVDVTNDSLINDSTALNGDLENKLNGANESMAEDMQNQTDDGISLASKEGTKNKDGDNATELSSSIGNEPLESEQPQIESTENKTEQMNTEDEDTNKRNQTEKVSMEEDTAENTLKVADNIETKDNDSEREAETKPDTSEEIAGEVEKLEAETKPDLTVETASENEKLTDETVPEVVNSKLDNIDTPKEDDVSEGQPKDESDNSVSPKIVSTADDKVLENKEGPLEAEENKEIEAIDKLLGEDTTKENLDKADNEIKSDSGEDKNMECSAESTKQIEEDKENTTLEPESGSVNEAKETDMNIRTLETETECVDKNETEKIEQATEVIQNDVTMKVNTTEPMATNTIPETTAEIENNSESISTIERPDEVTNCTETTSNGTQEIKENKRKLSTEDDQAVNVTTKKAKLDEDTPSCVRPKRVKRVFKGATFWGSNFREKLCTCSECISMYKDLSVLYLIDPEDTVTAYEALGKEKTDGAPATQYEKGLQALSSLDRIQQINALTEYNRMRDKLLDFLKSFKDRKEVVKEEDIKAFFAGMKPTRESDGVYFCR